MAPMAPENLPKTNEEWTLFFKILAWFTGVIFSIMGIVKVSVFISKNVYKIIEMIKSYEELERRLNNFVTHEDLETFQNNCKLQNELDINSAIKLLSDVVIALNAKVDILLEERGLYENDYLGKRKRKTDLPKGISINPKKY